MNKSSVAFKKFQQAFVHSQKELKALEKGKIQLQKSVKMYNFSTVKNLGKIQPIAIVIFSTCRSNPPLSHKKYPEKRKVTAQY